MTEQSTHDFHARSVPDVLNAFQANPEGLEHDEAASRLARFGANRLSEQPRRGPVVRFLLHFHNILIYVLLASAIITAALGHMIDTGVILAVVVANAIIGFIQEGRAENAMAAIRGMLALRSAVLRGGQRQTIDAIDLVPGDIVLLEAGDRVPADVRLIEARSVKVEEAILTGESVPVDKASAPVPEAASLGDRASMAFSGTLLVSGAARGLVVATGSNTEIGQISGMLSRVETLTTPLVRQMDVFARWLTVFILLVSAGLLAFGIFVRHLPFDGIFMIVVGLAVAAIPEGLPAVLTITLAVGVQAMARRNAIVRRFDQPWLKREPRGLAIGVEQHRGAQRLEPGIYRADRYQLQHDSSDPLAVRGATAGAGLSDRYHCRTCSSTVALKTPARNVKQEGLGRSHLPA